MKKFLLLLSVILFTNGILNILNAQSTCAYKMWGQNPTAIGCNDGAVWTELPSTMDHSIRHDVYHDGQYYTTVYIGVVAPNTWSSNLVLGTGTYEYYAYREGSTTSCNYHKVVITKPINNLGITNLKAINSNTSCSGGSITGKLKGDYCGTINISLVDALGNKYTNMVLSNDSTFKFSKLPTNNYILTLRSNNDTLMYKTFNLYLTSIKNDLSLSVANITKSSATLKWTANDCYTYGYNVQYKVYGTTYWNSITTSNIQVSLANLLPSRRYQWKVCSISNMNPIIYTTFSDIKTFYTLAAREANPLRESQNENLNNLVNLLLYPNPATQNITLSFDAKGGDVDINILNSIGKVVLQQHYSSDTGIFSEELDIKDLPSGIYLMTISTDETLQTKQFVKQ